MTEFKATLLSNALAAERYVLVKRGLFYRPDACGYTDALLYAGTYSKEDAESHCNSSSGEVTMRPLSDMLKHLKDTRFDPIILKAVLYGLD